MPETMGQRIRRSRGERTLRTAAKELEIQPSNLSDIENDRRMPSDRVKRLISEKFGVPYQELEALDGRLDTDIKQWAEKDPQVQAMLRTMKDRNVSPTEVINQYLNKGKEKK